MENLDLRVGDKYRLIRRLGKGGFGLVYQGTNLDTHEDVAIKLEHVSTDPSILADEVRVYDMLSHGPGIPRVYWHGTECEYNAIVFDLLGPSLEDLFNYCGRRFSLKTVLMLADQLIRRMEYIHSRDIIHRDIKPENFLMGVGRLGNQVYVTDLGLAWSEYTTATSRKSHHLMGTPRYASISGHLGNEQCRRDDMESLGYVLVYFIRGSLPWQGLKAASESEKDELIRGKKETTTPEALCHDLPSEFAGYFKHVRSLGFQDKPNYARLRKSFRSLFLGQGFEYDHVSTGHS